MMRCIQERILLQVVVKVALVWLANGENNTDAIISSSMTDFMYKSYESSYNNFESTTIAPPLVEFLGTQTSLLPSYSSSEVFSEATDVSYFDSFDYSSNTMLLSSVPEYNTLLKNDISHVVNKIETTEFVIDISSSIHSTHSTSVPILSFLSTPTTVLKSLDEESNVYIPSNSSMRLPDEEPLMKSKTTRAIIDTSPFPHFHTPLMSLLVASSSLPFQSEESYETSVYYSSVTPYPTPDNESTTTEITTGPPEPDHKKLLMLVLRAEDCSKLSKADFEKMLGKLMAKFGFGDVVPQVSNAQCHSHLHINLTLGNTAPTLRFLPNMDGKNNVTVDVLNRTFRIVKVEKVDLRFEKSHSFNVSSGIITKIAKHESITYVAIGVVFGLVLVICIFVCCVKCCLHNSKKRYISDAKCTHMRLRPEDYTLTPIPRPNSLYADYYRGSAAAADIYSSTSAGSITSTPLVEKGVIQSFDTSIVPLEDSAGAVALDISRDPSVESVPSDMKTFHIQNFVAKGHLNAATDSKEHLNPRHNPKNPDPKTSGFANPTFQRY